MRCTNNRYLSYHISLAFRGSRILWSKNIQVLKVTAELQHVSWLLNYEIYWHWNLFAKLCMQIAVFNRLQSRILASIFRQRQVILDHCRTWVVFSSHLVLQMTILVTQHIITSVRCVLVAHRAVLDRGIAAPVLDPNHLFYIQLFKASTRFVHWTLYLSPSRNSAVNFRLTLI